MKKSIHLFCIILLSSLLSGFFWKDITWESVNAEIDRVYPCIASISTDDLRKYSQKWGRLLKPEKHQYELEIP